MPGFIRCSHRVVYENSWLRFEAHAIAHPNGSSGEHGLVALPPAIGVVIVDGDTAYLTRQERFAARANVLEIVKGGAADGETTLAAAQRETREELGIVARRWTAMGFAYEIPSIVDPPVALFLAQGVRFVATEQERVESIERAALSFAEVLAMAVDGRLADAISVTAIVRAAHLMNALSLQGRPTATEDRSPMQNGNHDHDHDDDVIDVYEDDSEDKQLAVALTDRVLTAIGGLATEDTEEAAETVARVYLRMLRAVREEE